MENEDKCLAWFPAPYLELLEEDDDIGSGFHTAGERFTSLSSVYNREVCSSLAESYMHLLPSSKTQACVVVCDL